MYISYNGYEFDADSSHLDASLTLQSDEADRLVVEHLWKFTVRAIVTPQYRAGVGTSTAVAMEIIKDALMTPGKLLKIWGYGFGYDLTINPPANYTGSSNETVTRDIKYGPKPRVLSWRPIGSFNAAEITWEIETRISPCPGQYEGLSALNFAVSFNINPRGYSTRTIAGYLTIATTFDEGGNIVASVDDHRGDIHAQDWKNAVREQNYVVSADKTRLDFTIIDREIESPNAYPDGVTLIEARHRISTKLNPDAKEFASLGIPSNEISATIQLAQNQPLSRAYNIFGAIVDAKRGPLFGAGIVCINEYLVIEEAFYENSISFVLRWRTNANLSEIINSQFLAVQLTTVGDWDSWNESMLFIKRNTGLNGARLGIETGSDNLTSLCHPNRADITTYAVPQIPPNTIMSAFCNELPDPEHSYLYWFDYYTRDYDSNTKVHNSLGAPTVTRNEFDVNRVTAKLADIDPSGYIQNHSQGPVTETWTWKGYAMRVGYPIPEPHRFTLGGKTVRVIGKPKFMSMYIGTFFCQKQYMAAWNITFVVDGTPADSWGDKQNKVIESPPVPQ